MTKLFKNALKAASGKDINGNDIYLTAPAIPVTYDMGLEDVNDLMELAHKGNSFLAIHYAFIFGFVMGNRATITRKLKKL